DGRIDALREGAKLVNSVRDRSKVDAFARELAGMVGLDPADVQREVRRSASRADQSPGPVRPVAPATGLPDPRDPRFVLERETLKLLVQRPDLLVGKVDDVADNDFTHPAYAGVWQAGLAAGGVAAADQIDSWSAQMLSATDDELVRSLITALAVESILSRKAPDAGYANQHVYRLREVTTMRRIAELKSKLQRTNPLEEVTEYNRMFGELVALEQTRRQLRELALEEQ
ncbi:MAG TPA: DNA primase, partial [Marmoricola sp.]|nr:DNA primase [Marmoricola sp.]